MYFKLWLRIGERKNDLYLKLASHQGERNKEHPEEHKRKGNTATMQLQPE